LCINSNKSNILIIIHCWDEQFDRNKLIGGTSFHVLDIIRLLRNEYNFYILTPHKNIYRLYSYWKNGEELIDIYSSVHQNCTNKYFNTEYEKIIIDIIDCFNIDIVHIHHMLGHFFNIINVKRNKIFKLIISLHDYYASCPNINKINKINKYCGFPSEKECNSCLSHNNKLINISTWKSNWNLLFKICDKIIVPSEAAKNEIFSTYENISIDVIEHGVGIKQIKSELNIDSDINFNVAFIGNITEVKGKKIIEDLIKYSNKHKNNINFHLFGAISSYILLKKNRNFFFHGEYNRDDITKLLRENNIKLTCIFSIWPETFCYTFIESIANNVPVFAIDIGAVGQKIRNNNLGWIIKNGTGISKIYQKIKNIFNNKNRYRNVIKSISNYKLKNLEEMSKEYDEIYSSYKINRKENDNNEIKRTFFKKKYLCITCKTDEKNSKYDRKKKQKNNFWRLNRVITWFPRNMKKLIKYYLENGIINTIKKLSNVLLKKLHLRI